jgi:hypothetical protein
MGDNKAAEMFVFREFAKVCPMPLLIDTAENREPPEPDIICDCASGERLAFELVEADNVTTNRAKPGETVAVRKYVNDSITLKEAIDDAYKAAVESGQLTDPSRFEYHFIRIHFHDSASIKKSIQAMPDAIALLNEHGTERHNFKHKVIRSIRCAPFSSRGPYKGPLISVNTNTHNVGLSVVDRIESKLGRSYITAHPIHLLVWSDTATIAENELWHDKATALIHSKGMQPFVHLWVFGRGQPSIVFDMSASEDGASK